MNFAYLKNIALKIFSFVYIFFIAQNIFASLTAADEIGTLLNKIRTMEASIEQTLYNQKGKKIGGTTTGSMMLERPGKFRWETKTPNHQLIIVNKDKSFLYDVDLEQAVKRKVDYNQPGNPAMLLSGSVNSIKKAFAVIKPKKDLFALTPKTKGNFYQKISIRFVNGKPTTMKIIDNLEQKSTISFKNIKINPKIPAENFIFTPPKNVEVLEAS